MSGRASSFSSYSERPRRPKRNIKQEEEEEEGEESPSKSILDRIPKKQRKSTEDPVVVQARKALEMFKEIEEEDGKAASTTSSTNSNQEDAKKEPNDKKENGKPKSPRWQNRRMPIISTNDNQLL